MKRTLILFFFILTLQNSSLFAQDFGSYASAVWLTNCSTSNFFNTTGEGASLIGPSENNFDNADLGIFFQNSGSLILRGGEVKTHKTTGVANVCNTRLNYRIYQTTETPESFITIDLPFFDDCNQESNQFPSGGPCTAGDQKWQRVIADGVTTPYAPVDLTNVTPGNYILEIYYDISGDFDSVSGCDDTIYISNFGQNFKAFFSIRNAPTYTVENPTSCNATDGSILIADLEPSHTYLFEYTFNGTVVSSENITTDTTGTYLLNNLGSGNFSNFTFISESGCFVYSENEILLSSPIFEAPTVEITQPDCFNNTGTITVTSPVGQIGGIASDLFFSEITDESSGALTYIEIYNGTGETKNLSNYIVKIYNNGNDYTSCELPLTGTIEDNTVVVISIGSNANQGGVIPDYIFSQCAGVNTNDNIRLTTVYGDEIDLWGRTDGIDFTPENAPGYTYRRIPTATVPSLVWNPDDWIAIDPQDYSDVGYYEYISVSSYEYSIDDINYQDGVTFSDLQPGTYLVTVRDTNTLCISLPTIVVIEDAPISENPEFEFENNLTICSGSEVFALPTTSENGISGSWLPENIDNTQSGTYTFTPDNECAESFTLIITVNSLPEIPAGDSTQSICSITTVIFELQDLSVVGSNLQWYADENLETSLLPSTPLVNNTIYYVTQTVEGCESEPLAILVFLNTVITPEFEFDNQFSICYGSDVIVLPTTSQNDIDGNWLPENIDNTQSGTYTFTPDNECAESFSLQISVSQSFDFDIEWACLNETYQLQLVNIPENAIIEWTLESGQTIGNNTFFNVTQYLSSGSEALPLTFYAHITNEQGCVKTKSFIVESVHCGIQKGISPNGDFKNDSFDLSLLNVKHLSIFSRYGIKVYEKENYTSEWSGQTNNGKELPDATYYYVIEFRNGDTKTGWVYINRELGR